MIDTVFQKNKVGRSYGEDLRVDVVRVSQGKQNLSRGSKIAWTFCVASRSSLGTQPYDIITTLLYLRYLTEGEEPL